MIRNGKDWALATFCSFAHCPGNYLGIHSIHNLLTLAALLMIMAVPIIKLKINRAN